MKKELKTVKQDINEQGVRTITLNRPDSLNAMNRQLIDDVFQAFTMAMNDENTRAIVFTGAGRAFCAGDDRKEHTHPENEAQARDLVQAIQRVSEAILFGDKPVVGAINGWAVGGGFEWAINCDFPIWSKTAKAFFPEVALNLFVTGAVTTLLPAIAGLNKAKEMLFLGETYNAKDLLEIGVAWRVTEEGKLMNEAYTVAHKLAGLPPLSVQSMKRTLNKTAFESIETALERETRATVTGFMSPETTRRLSDF